MTMEGNGHPPVRNGNGRMRRIARYALPTGAALGAGAALAAAQAPGDATTDAVVTPSAATSSATFPRAASDYLLEIDGVKGESTDQKHPGAIDVDWFSMGDGSVRTRSVGTGGGAGRVSFDDFTFKKNVDASSPTLLLDSATGKHIQSAVFYASASGGDGTRRDYLKITLTDVVVTSYHLESQRAAGDGEVETVSLGFEKISYAYTPQSRTDAAGEPVTVGWDLLKLKAA